jgi:MFS superfamily sulfate permease-like transporter
MSPMVKIKSFEFSLRELAGSMGDFGTLFPLAVGYIAVCGLDPCGLLVMMGIANIVTGIVYRLPMPIEPMKVLAVVAIAQQWTPSMVYASGFAMGIVWLLFGLTNVIGFIAKNTPLSVVRGIQIALGVLLAVPAVTMIQGSWALAIISILIIVFFRDSRWAPAAVVLMLMGLVIMYFRGDLTGLGGLGLTLPTPMLFSARDIFTTFVHGGLAQIPLTATNAVIATAALISHYFPDRPVTERKLAINMGVMNLAFPFFGGMPLCHGCGGLAGQYYFGARTGGANIIEGVIEISLGLFAAAWLVQLFSGFPTAIIGAMLFLVGLELVKFVRDIRWGLDIIPLSITVISAVFTNMAVGFAAGIIADRLVAFYSRRRQRA